jgi:hypothetical protein
MPQHPATTRSSREVTEDRLAIPLVARAYSERQRIVVVETPIDRAELEERSVDATAKVVGLVMGAAALVVLPLGFTLAHAFARWLRRAREQGLEILPVSRAEAATLTFPPGHPKVGRVLYIGHPTIPSVYYPAAHFHRLTFEHKLSEAVRLLMALGATRIESEREFGWSREFAARLNVPLGSPAEAVGGAAGGGRSSGAQILFKARLRNTATPAVPEGLVWYPHETTWQTVADGRLHHGLEEFSLVVNYEDDFGVNAKLQASIAGTPLGLGGQFDAHEATRWRMVGTFAQSPSQ